jgi:hypothetical protein
LIPRRETVRIGPGSSWWGSRFEPARRNVEEGDLDYLCYETMSESTMSVAQVRRLQEPAAPGYDTRLDDRLRAVLPACLERGTRIVSNQGWLDPAAAARRIVELLREQGAAGVKVAAVGGGVLNERVLELADTILETGAPLSSVRDTLISAEVYLGVEPIVEALRQDAAIVVTGRVADAALFAAPLIHELGWDRADDTLVARGYTVGHLLECAANVTGGYFADPGFKEVPLPWDLTFPIAEVAADGSAVIGKLPGGGMVDLPTVKEQLLYEVHDPGSYLTPDVVCDFTTVELEQVGPDRVRVSGASGRPRTATLKATIGCREGYVGEDMFFNAGPGALARAQLSRRVLEERFAAIALDAEEVRIDLLGVDALHGPATPAPAHEPYEVGVRVAVRAATAGEAERALREVDAITGSAAMTGKRRPMAQRTQPIIGIWSALVPREAVTPEVSYYES